MREIKLLPENVIDQIAAGEIIERPASVVKELVENSMDAGSSKIIVEIASGGKKRICVTDDGHGMDRPNLLKCIRRFATSKIATTEDIDRIRTYGFRGEAIPSIASVSQMTIVSADPGSGTAASLQINGGKEEELREAVLGKGTKITVANLFYNIPARLKFLKTDATETRKILFWMEAFSIARPDIAFSLISEGNVLFQTSAKKSLGDRLCDVYGNDFLKSAKSFEFSFSTGKVQGMLTLPDNTRRDRTGIRTFVNGRLVQSQILSFTVSKFYRDKIPHGNYPTVVLLVDILPGLVDVNVHPAKLEVRFRNEDEVIASCFKAFSLAFQANGLSLEREKDQPQGAFPVSLPEEGRTFVATNTDSLKKELYESLVLSDSSPALLLKEIPQGPGEVIRPSSPIRLLGQVKNRYLVVEMEEGLAILDQHASHERVLYERTLKLKEKKAVESQQLLMPEVLNFSSNDSGILEENLEGLNKVGFGIERFGKNTFKIDSVPAEVPPKGLKAYFSGLISYLLDSSNGKPGIEKLIRGVCRQSVMFGDPLKKEEQEQLIEDLFRCENPYSCPHGRPLLYKLNWNEIDRRFLR